MGSHKKSITALLNKCYITRGCVKRGHFKREVRHVLKLFLHHVQEFTREHICTIVPSWNINKATLFQWRALWIIVLRSVVMLLCCVRYIKQARANNSKNRFSNATRRFTVKMLHHVGMTEYQKPEEKKKWWSRRYTYLTII